MNMDEQARTKAIHYNTKASQKLNMQDKFSPQSLKNSDFYNHFYKITGWSSRI